MAKKATQGTVTLQPPDPPKKKLDYKVRAGRLGGLATAQKYIAQNPDWAKERSSRGGVAVKIRYGIDYFKFLAHRRTKLGNPVVEL